MEKEKKTKSSKKSKQRMTAWLTYDWQISGETTIDEYIDFDSEIITSDPAVDQTHAYWRQERMSRKRHCRGLAIRKYC